jgi:catalase
VSQTENEQAHIASALVFELSKVTLAHVRARVSRGCATSTRTWPARVAAGLAMDLPAKAKAAREPVDYDASDALSIQKKAKRHASRAARWPSCSTKARTRRPSRSSRATSSRPGGSVFLVAPKVGPPAGQGRHAPGRRPAGRLALGAVRRRRRILMPAQADKLARDGAAVQWFMDAYGHCKVIGHCKGSQVLLDKAALGARAQGADAGVNATTGGRPR